MVAPRADTKPYRGNTPTISGVDLDLTAARPTDEDAFPKELVAERRIVVRLRTERLRGTALDIES